MNALSAPGDAAAISDATGKPILVATEPTVAGAPDGSIRRSASLPV